MRFYGKRFYRANPVYGFHKTALSLAFNAVELIQPFLV